MQDDFRIERDSMGELQVPADALFGAQTQRAIDNFPVSGRTMPARFVRALGLIKAACAAANENLGLLEPEIARRIRDAALAVAGGSHLDQFPVDVFQTGSGTSSNMNANEVIARLASDDSCTVHPNDHVNMSQSSNDVIPTAIHVSAALSLQEHLKPELLHLVETIDARARELEDVVKTGRTHLMDAMPVTLAQELRGWSGQLLDCMDRLEEGGRRLLRLPQGGTAVGTGINTHPDFDKAFCQELARETGLSFGPADNKFVGISSQDTAVEVSGQLRVLAVALMKIANDLRWMNSGPLAGLGEIELPALQPGSSIMPGKVNPVVPESVAMVSAHVMGNDAAIGVAGQSGNFQLNVMLPMIALNLLESIDTLGNGSRILADKAIAGFTVREDNLREALDRNPILVTALNPVIGYEKGAAIAKQAYAEGRPIIDVAEEKTELSREELERLLDPRTLTEGGMGG